MKKNILNYTQFIREFVDIENLTPVEKVMHSTKNALPQEFVEDAKKMNAEKEIEEKEKESKKEEAEKEENNDGKIVEPTVKPIG